MTFYEFLVFLHIASTIIGLGAGFLLVGIRKAPGSRAHDAVPGT